MPASRPPQGWPQPIADTAFIGPAAHVVQALEPHTEADTNALLLQLLVMFGNCVGRGPHFVAEADEHHANLYLAQVGETSKGRKGSSFGRLRSLFKTIDGDWTTSRIRSGASSGEGLIDAIRDPVTELRHDPTSKARGFVQVDAGEPDKRLLIFEGEFAGTLRVMGRDGNSLSAVLRNAWDSGDLGTLVRNARLRATGACVSLIGHTTRPDLRRYLSETEQANGFGNRILWAAVRRSKVLPDGGQPVNLGLWADILRQRRDFARRVGEVQRDPAARAFWHEVYPDLSEGKPGLLGAVLGRAEAQVMRLAMIYALLNERSVIERLHLRAALEVWRFCADSAAYIFGDATGDPNADQILDALRRAANGLTRTEIRDLFSRNLPGAAMDRALERLDGVGRARRAMEETAGRYRERWHAITTETTKPLGQRPSVVTPPYFRRTSSDASVVSVVDPPGYWDRPEGLSLAASEPSAEDED